MLCCNYSLDDATFLQASHAYLGPREHQLEAQNQLEHLSKKSTDQADTQSLA
jgi:hypothetical protein